MEKFIGKSSLYREKILFHFKSNWEFAGNSIFTSLKNYSFLRLHNFRIFYKKLIGILYAR
jgi:hypothetical protein